MGKINSDKEGKATIVKYLTNQNRPYSVNDLVANLHNEISKALMQKSLDTLVEESKVKEKVNGKQKAYFINQDDFPIASEVNSIFFHQYSDNLLSSIIGRPQKIGCRMQRGTRRADEAQWTNQNQRGKNQSI